MTVITVYADPNQNDAPEVYAGSDYSGDLAVGGLVVDFDNDLTEEPSVTDDGLPDPPNSVEVKWWVAVGDVTAVSFSDIDVVKPTVTFTKTGTYVLQVDADDDQFANPFYALNPVLKSRFYFIFILSILCFFLRDFVLRKSRNFGVWKVTEGYDVVAFGSYRRRQNWSNGIIRDEAGETIYGS